MITKALNQNRNFENLSTTKYLIKKTTFLISV